ncbi:hypothetical protein FA09DRAFT_328590 [Tilletiopsis washingtonensis]|uniref:Nudix hydrolase domain-containing protein n=1 Tax=Tilletiopsis washingtonensis TaxID=58919 RepID=A0A316ZFK5_9BASI|nr:hypothetical protein FA09DRAFT_328590 [Tilletiopsis washingtonensis]PWN99808.1 hypothetical protein FA09DRAFT_328590 [Tilletiopsis washingtonensis]
MCLCPSRVPAPCRRIGAQPCCWVCSAGGRGDLHVVLSQRALGLRSHGGDTAIPGGRFELGDADMEACARREAWEETGLPINPAASPKLCELRAFLSANELVVTPVVVLLTDPTQQPNLNPREVSSLFSVPLRAFLYHVPPVALRPSLRLPAMPSEDDMLSASEVSGPSDWHHCRDISWFGERIRRHDFWHRSNPIRGLTSDILIHAAWLAYGQEPSFVLRAPNQPSDAALIRTAFEGPLAIRKRRVRPRMGPLAQPVDDDDKEGTPGKSKL